MLTWGSGGSGGDSRSVAAQLSGCVGSRQPAVGLPAADSTVTQLREFLFGSGPLDSADDEIFQELDRNWGSMRETLGQPS